MKLNNKGFAISSIMYLILIMAVLLIVITLTLLGNRKVILDKIKETTQEEIYADAEFTKICKAVDSETVTTGNIPSGYFKTGDEYICKVNATTSYHFFLLSDNNNGTINLIMDRNIYYNSSTGLSSTTNNSSGNVEWYATADTSYGPSKAMQYVYNATKYWKNLSNISVKYTDTGSQYGGVKTTGIRTAITRSDAEEAIVFNNLKARLPYYSEMIDLGCTTSNDSCPLWISNYLHTSTNGGTNIPDIYGYWLMDSIDSTSAWGISYTGNLDNSASYGTVSNVYRGVRPVITVKKSDIEGNNENTKYCTAVEVSSNGNHPEGLYEAGDEYICRVSANQSYNFYVLSSSEDDDDVVLIAAENIYYDSTNEITNVVDDTNTGYVKWGTTDNLSGPISAFTYLYNATKDWDNVKDLKLNLLDENTNFSDYQEGLHNSGYGKILTVDEETTIYKKAVDGAYTISTGTFDNVKARLPMMYELTKNGCRSTSNSCPLWLNGTKYYWTLSSVNESTTEAYAITNRNYTNVSVENNSVGIRPVVVFSKSNFKN